MVTARRTLFLAAGTALVALAAAAKTSSSCREFLIPVNLEAEQYDLDLVINTNWDVEDYIFNSTRRDSLETFNPIVGSRLVNVSHTIGATFCTPRLRTNASETLLILTHGSMVDRSYWNPDFDGSDRYNFVQHALQQSYPVFFYDRLGTGESGRPDPIVKVQFAVQAQILAKLTQLLRQPNSPYTLGTTVRRTVHVGHSFGSFLTLAAVASNLTTRLTDGLVLTGYSGQYDWLQLFTAGGQARVAALSQPKTWSNLPHGYLVPVDVYAAAYGGFKAPYFDHAVAEKLQESQTPYAIGELVTAATVVPPLSRVTVPIQVVQGKYDLTACGGYCPGVLNKTAALFPNSSRVEVNGSFDAGHQINYHYDAQNAFHAITEFVSKIV